MNSNISSLINYYIEKNYIKSDDAIYIANKIAGMINLTEINYDSNTNANLYDSLKNIVDYAVSTNQIENFVYEKEILESKITDLFIERPSIVQNNFDNSPIVEAYTNFYNQCVDTNYIKKKDLEKNVHFEYTVDDMPIEISINLAKPEKDPKEIEKLKQMSSTSYPKCPLCIENVGYLGSVKSSARTNHRVINLELNNQEWFFQYSPYLYYNYHCILIEKKHEDMKVTNDTVKVQLDFVDKFENFFIGNNAELPIVGGSILNHNHFQGGMYNFPIESAKANYIETINNVKIDQLDWHLATIRLSSNSKEDIIKQANLIKDNWKAYQDDSNNIFNDNNNAVNFICRKVADEYIVYIILRNNKTTEEYKSGLYHPTPNYFHIKKENIGLIEAMGLAILPARLVKELDEVKKFITEDALLNDSPHLEWAKELKDVYNGEEINKFIQCAIANRFVEILKCCNVLKYCNNKTEIIEKLIK